MNKRLALCLLTVLAACGGGGGGSGDSGGGPPATTYALSGKAQKGPFAIGSQITASELSDSLSATGKSLTAQTTDNLGSFSFGTQIGTRLVDISATGYYLDEISGRLSASTLNLHATVDLSVLPTPTVNVLTALQAPRLKTLMGQGQAFTAAYGQAQNDVLAAFGVDPAKVTGLTTLDAMRIDGTKDADAVLLAVSATVAQMATDAAKANGTNQAAELSNLVNTMASQIGSSGAVTTASIIAARKLAQTEINVSAVRSNLETYYASQSTTIVAPKFEEWLDASGSGVIPQRQVAVNGLVFADVTGAVPASLITSNAVTVAGLGAGVSVAVSVDAGSTLIKNGQAVSGQRTIAQNGDVLAIRVTSDGYSLTRTATLTVGATSTTWRVASRALGGGITGLTGSGLVLQLNASETVNIAAGSTSFAFASPLANGATYAITVLTPPSNPAQICAVANGDGKVSTEVVTVSVTCYAAGAASIAKVEGDLQTVVQHLAIPVIPKVVVTDRLNNPVPNAQVTFQASNGYYATHPVTVATDFSGVARLYLNVIGEAAGSPYELFYHLAGPQSLTATLGDGASVRFDFTVTPSTHAYDGKYICAPFPWAFFRVVNGQKDYPEVLSFMVLDEATGKLVIDYGSNYRAHYYGQIVLDSAQHATLTGTYTASTFGGQSTDPIGIWSCDRL